MNLAELSSFADILSAAGVLITLIYLARQVRQGNLLARSQTRQWMIEQAQIELYKWMDDPELRHCIVKPGPLTPDEQGKLHYFLVAAMRQREWEWFQGRDKIVSKDVQNAYLGVVGLHLGVDRTRNWWKRVGHVGFDPAFVADVNAFLEGQPPMSYFEELSAYEGPVTKRPARKRTSRRRAPAR